MNPMTETYLLASKARAKLAREAARPEHNLRVLVSHANLLDNLMDKIQEHRTAILNGDYTANKIQFQLPKISHVSYIEEEEDDDETDSESDDDEESGAMEIHYETSEILYDSDSDEDYESEDDISDEDSVFSVTDYTYVPAVPKKFRQMPFIGELSEQELEEMESHSASDDDEVDIVDLKRTPSLTYADTTDESEDEEDEDEDKAVLQEQQVTHDKTLSRKLSQGNLMLESLSQHDFSSEILV